MVEFDDKVDGGRSLERAMYAARELDQANEDNSIVREDVLREIENILDLHNVITIDYNSERYVFPLAYRREGVRVYVGPIGGDDMFSTYIHATYVPSEVLFEQQLSILKMRISLGIRAVNRMTEQNRTPYDDSLLNFFESYKVKVQE